MDCLNEWNRGDHGWEILRTEKSRFVLNFLGNWSQNLLKFGLAVFRGEIPMEFNTQSHGVYSLTSYERL